MADYYTNLSVELKLDIEVINWALQLNRYLIDMYHIGITTLPFPPSITAAARKLMKQLGEDYCCRCAVITDGYKLFISDDGGEADEVATAAYIQAVLKQFNLDKCVRMNISYTCSRPIPDGFGGDVCIITRKDIAWLNVDEWIVNKEAELLEKLKEEESGEKSGEKA